MTGTTSLKTEAIPAIPNTTALTTRAIIRVRIATIIQKMDLLHTSNILNSDHHPILHILNPLISRPQHNPRLQEQMGLLRIHQANTIPPEEVAANTILRSVHTLIIGHSSLIILLSRPVNHNKLLEMNHGTMLHLLKTNRQHRLIWAIAIL